MRLPDSVQDAIERAVGRIDRVEGVSGGSISPACRLVAGGQVYFLKIARDLSREFFAVEAAGLDLMRGAGVPLKIPRVAHVGHEESTAWLLLEWLEPGHTSSFSADLGRGLATLHQQQNPHWGWDRDGFIGSLAQSNRPRRGWIDFWWDERLIPQIRMAEKWFDPGIGLDALCAALKRALTPIEDEGASLLHGDLWSGNVLSTSEGPAIFDPACYFGHREVDLAMTELFGGFDNAFYAAYNEVWPLRPGYQGRRAAYQLYYLLVHVNLFGGSYAARARETLRHLLAA